MNKYASSTALVLIEYIFSLILDLKFNEDDGFCDIDVDRAGFWYLLYLSAVLCAADRGDSVCDFTGNERLGVDYWVIHLLAISELRETAVRVKE